MFMSQLGRGMRIWLGRVISPVILVGGLALFAGAANAKAQDWEDCNRQMAYAKGQLHEAIEDYGYYSRQANYWRHEVHETYERCAQQGYESSRGRNERGYDRGNDEGGYRQENVDAAVQRGYRDGQAAGYKDGRSRREYRPEKHDDYEDGDRGYYREYGDRNYYKQQYREGFLRGYQDAYYGR